VGIIMPKYKNRFDSPAYVEHYILGPDGKSIGTLRIKPSAVLWKGRGKREFVAVDLDTFTAWISDPSTKSRKSKT
jgi:hypothetical protein